MIDHKEHILVTIGRNQFTNLEREFIDFVSNPAINTLLNDIKDHLMPLY